MKKTQLAFLIATAALSGALHAQTPATGTMAAPMAAGQQPIQQVVQMLEQAEAAMRNNDQATAAQLLDRSAAQVDQQLMQASGDRKQSLTVLQQKIAEARQAVGSKDPQGVARLTHAREQSSNFQADARAQLQIDVPKPQVSVQQANPTVRVQQASPQVTVDPGRPTIEVNQAAPQVRVQMQQPIITIDMPRPTITVSMPDPKVAVSMQQPTVTVDQAQPTVRVEQGQPQVRVNETAQPAGVMAQPTTTTPAQVMVAPGQPKVEVTQQDAQVKVTAQQPIVNYKSAEPVVNVTNTGEAKVQVNQTGDPKVTIRQMTADETQRAASMTPPAAAASASK